jgi:basic membrane protein A
VLTHHSASPAVVAAAERRGVKVVAYHSDMRAIAPHAQITAVVHEWGTHYTQAVRSAVEGRWRPVPVWGGLRDGFIRLAPLHESVPADVARHVDRRRVQIISGAFQPFSGRLLDSAGRLRSAGGALADPAIAKMDWFVEGVVGTLPKS